MMGEVTLATVAMNVTYDKAKNLEKYMKFIDEAAAKGAKLVVFPEQSLQGYLKSLVALDFENLAYHHKNAEPVPEGESVQKLIDKAKEKEIYIIWGMTEVDEKEGVEVLYNTAVLVGPDGYVGKYRKVHQPLDELHVFFPGDGFYVYETEIGKIGMLICYDKAFPESCRELALQGAEILVMPTAWPLTQPGGLPNVEEDYLTKLYNLFDVVRAVENQCWFISSNHVGMCGDHDYLGHSRIVAPNGEVVAEVGYEEGMAVATVDVKEGIRKARTLDLLGLNLLKDRRPAAYKRLTLERRELLQTT